MELLVELIATHEDWLMQRLGVHTDAEIKSGPEWITPEVVGPMRNGACRRSVALSSQALMEALEAREAGDEVAVERTLATLSQRLAATHHAHHVGLVLFMSMLKAYRRAYLDLATLEDLPREVEARYRHELERLWDRLEVACCQAWERPAARSLLPICAHCKKIRDEQGEWQALERYLFERLGVRFTHGICPECMAEYYPEPAVPLKAMEWGARLNR